MATETKSIEIAYKANINDLKAKLSSIPDITAQEAKKMVAALDRQLKQSEKAAKKSAEASKKAAQSAAKAAQRGQNEFDGLAHSAQRAEDKMHQVGEASGDIDRGFSSIEIALRGINPQLAEAAGGMADAFAVTEGLSMSFAALNPLVLASAAAVGAVVLGYMSYQQEIEKARQLTLDMRDAQKSLNGEYEEVGARLNDSVDKLGDVRDEYALITGEIDKYELALRRTERATKEQFQGNIDAQNEVIDQRKEELKLVERMMSANLQGLENAAILSDTEKERLRNLQLITKGVNKNLDLTENDYTLNVQLNKIKQALSNEINTQNKALEIMEGHQKTAVDLALQIQEFENETTKAKEAQKGAQKEIVQLTEEEVDLVSNLIKLDLERYDRQRSASEQLRDISEKTLLDDDELKQLNFDREIERIRQLGEESEQQELAQQTIDKMLHDATMEQIKTEKEARDELAKKRAEDSRKSLQDTEDLVSALSAFSGAAMAAAQENGKANQKVINGLFAMQQGAAVAEIAFNTAKAISASLSYPPPLNAIMATLATATGAAQTAAVMSQQPPQASFHMGGMAPDEMGARVLKGEAVLDRATVRNLGGEQGVKQLQQGQGQTPALVIQPFKHFGRFTREIGFRPAKRTGIRAY